MTTPITSDQAMTAVAAARPDPELIDESWDGARADRVFEQFDPAAPAKATNRSRRWVLIGAAAALVAALGLIAQSLVPAGSPGSPAAAQALEQLSLRVTAITIPAGSFYKETIRNSFTISGPTPETHQSVVTKWMAADGWVWAKEGPGPEQSLAYRKGPDYVEVSASSLLPKPLPADPAAVKSELAKAYEEHWRQWGKTNGTGTEARMPLNLVMMTAIYAALTDPRTELADRAILIRTLALVERTTVTQNSTDPAGRTAVQAKITYPLPGTSTEREFAVYLDPADAQVLATQTGVVSGGVLTGDIEATTITGREIVGALPADVLKALGTKRVSKTVQG